MVRILGIDPGSRVTGFGIIDSDGSRSRHVVSGCVRTGGNDFAARLGEIYRELRAVIARHGPQQVAIEQVFMAKNASAALKLGQARGAAIVAAVDGELPVFEYSAREVKQALVGKGGAEKEQVQYMVQLLLGVRREMPLDESDALAVALCHAHHHALQARLEGRA